MFLFLHILLLSTLGAEAATFVVQNRCENPIWPVVHPLREYPNLVNNDIRLDPHEKVNITAPDTWMGQLWARTECSTDQAGGLNCTTGNCGGVECGGPSHTPPPTTVANFQLVANATDYYYMSIVDGYNIQLSIVPSGGSGDCRPVACVEDLNNRCPNELQVKSDGRMVACKSACMAFNQPKYCCTGAYDRPEACKPSNYSQIFKRSCPTAFTYPLDDQNTVRSCRGADFLISFC